MKNRMCNHNTNDIEIIVSERLEPATAPTVLEIMPLTIINFDRKPDNGGTPARASMKTSIEMAINGSRRARP